MKKPYSTKIDENILDDFKEKCKKNDLFTSEALEALMQAYVNDEIGISVKTIYQVTKEKEVE